jgi:hypothetical protein
MPDLARPIVRPSPHPQRTKVLLVRQPVKSVRSSDEPDRTMIRLVIGVLAVLGIAAAVWLLGHVGFRLGFAPMIGLPELASYPGEGFVTGMLMLIAGPRVILQAAIEQPMWLLVAFGLLAVPAAGLSAAKPRAPGGPALSPLAVSASHAAIVLGALHTIAITWWTVAPQRSALVRELPLNPEQATLWLRDLQTAAGIDLLAFVTAALWVVLAFRLPVALWLKALLASACFFALVVVMVAMAVTSGASAHVETGRSLCILEERDHWRLLLGHVGERMATLEITQQGAGIELIDPANGTVVYGRRSIIDEYDLVARQMREAKQR